MTAAVAPLPPDEQQRLAALRRYGITEVPTGSDYDDIVHIAARLCDAPMAQINFIEERTQITRGDVGLDGDVGDRSTSFCSHTILTDEVMVVPDAFDDPRFAGNPLVTGPPKIRSYYGAPLITPDGYRVGALCVVDREPRDLDPEQIAALGALSRQVVRLLEHRRVTLALLDVAQEFEEFSARTAHDLKNPLAAIRGYADLLLRKHDRLDPETRVDITTRLGELATATTTLVDDVLSQAKEGALGLRARSRTAEVVGAVLSQAELKDAETQTTGEWPDVAVSNVDLRCIVSNLVANADHYGRSADGVLRLTVSGTVEGTMLRLAVTDEGPGIDLRIRASAFDAFVHGPDSRLRNAGSSGLGMALVRRAAQHAGGSVELEPTAVGTSVVAWLPVDAQSTEPAQGPPSP